MIRSVTSARTIFFRRFTAPLLALMCMVGLVAGCQFDGGKSNAQRPPRPVSLAEFAARTADVDATPHVSADRDDEAHADVTARPDVDPGSDPSAAPPAATVTRATDRIRQETLPGRPGQRTLTQRNQEHESLRLVQPGERIVIESLIGQVNGRPIFADDFFAEYDDRLIQEAREKSPLAFEQEVEDSVRLWLHRVLDNELVLSEAESRLTPEMQHGLFAMLRELEERRIAQARRTLARAERELAGEDMTMADYLQARRDDLLIHQVIRSRVGPRINISWRDVERAYERNFDRYNRPGAAHVYRLTLSRATQQELIDQAADLFVQQRPFFEVVEQIGLSRDQLASDRWPVSSVDGRPTGLADTVYEALPEAIEAGVVSQPVVTERNVNWFYVSEIDPPVRRPLHHPDVQLELRDELFARRYAEEERKFLNTLRGDGNHDGIEVMVNRLKRLALQRYVR